MGVRHGHGHGRRQGGSGATCKDRDTYAPGRSPGIAFPAVRSPHLQQRLRATPSPCRAHFTPPSCRITPINPHPPSPTCTHLATHCRTSSLQYASARSTAGCPTTTSSARLRVTATLKRRGCAHRPTTDASSSPSSPCSSSSPSPLLALPPLAVGAVAAERARRAAAAVAAAALAARPGSESTELSTVEMNTMRSSWPCG